MAQARAGQPERAREALLRVIERDERNLPAWLWLSSVVDDPADKRVALENVLTLDPANAPARAGLDWLDKQAPVSVLPAGAGAVREQTPGDPSELMAEPEAAEPIAEATPMDLGEPEQEHCPYCGQPTLGLAVACPQCKMPLNEYRLKSPDFPPRVLVLSFAWLVLAASDIVGAALNLIMLALAAAGSAGGSLLYQYILTYAAGAAFAAKTPLAELWQPSLVFMAMDTVAAVWCVLMALIMPWRRAAAPGVALFVAALHAAVAAGGFAAGMSAWGVSAARLASSVLVGGWVLGMQDDFTWQMVRHRLGLERGLKTGMDYYSRGRYYRRMGQTANAILHWERAVLLAPDKLAYRVALANAHYALAHYDRAAEQLQAALALDPAADVRGFLETVNARRSADSRTGPTARRPLPKRPGRAF
jgi:tetratricopeptide (TPR) repeat protein